jgi:hypothetical protein
VLQELRKSGEVVDAVRLNDKVLIVEFSRALSGAVLRRLERTCFAAQLIFPACVLQVTTALDSLGAELAREEARGGGETLTQHCRWLAELQFSHSLSNWLRDKLHALRNPDTVELSDGVSSSEFAWSDDSVASDSSRDTPVVTRRAAIGGKRKADAAVVPGGRATAADYGEDMIAYRPNKRSSAPGTQAAAAGPKRAAQSKSSSRGGTKRGTIGGGGSVVAGERAGVGVPATAGVMSNRSAKHAVIDLTDA